MHNSTTEAITASNRIKVWKFSLILMFFSICYNKRNYFKKTKCCHIQKSKLESIVFSNHENDNHVDRFTDLSYRNILKDYQNILIKIVKDISKIFFFYSFKWRIYPTLHQVRFDTRSFKCGEPHTNQDMHGYHTHTKKKLNLLGIPL